MNQKIKKISLILLILILLIIGRVNANETEEIDEGTDVKQEEVIKTISLKYDKKYRMYQNGNKYYQIQEKIKFYGGDYNLSTSSIGLKVCKVNQKLLNKTSGYYTRATKKAVKKFQKKKKLKQTGKVDYKTWKKLGFSNSDWKYLSTYVTKLKVARSSTREEHIQAMVDTAYEYKNAKTKYVVGASGKPGTYVDCSGLIFQCLYSIGINPTLTIIDHCKLKYEYGSKYLSEDTKLGRKITKKSIKSGKEVLKKGDLIFFGKPVNHIALYVGKGKIIDATYAGVTKRKLSNNYTMVIRMLEEENIDSSSDGTAKVKINTTDKVYTGKDIRPRVVVTYGNKKLKENEDYKVIYKNNKNIGKGTIKVEGIGSLKGTASASFYIIPNNTEVISVKNVSKKKAVVKWKKGTKVDGYEIYMATTLNGKYKKIKTIKSSKINTYKKTKLKKNKTYYFKIRNYKNVKGKKLYSSYSNIKSAKIKK